MALEALLAVLEAVRAGGAPPPLDDRTTSSLLATARSLASNEGSGPKAMEAASRLTAAVAVSHNTGVQLQLARTALALRTTILKVGVGPHHEACAV